MTKQDENENSNKRKQHPSDDDHDDDNDDNCDTSTKVDDDNKNNDDNDNDKQNQKRKRKRKRKKKSNTTNTNTSSSTGDDNNKDDDDYDVVNKFNSLLHTVYVEGIPFDCTEEEVKNFFIEHGCVDVIQLRLPRWQDTGRLRGFGHIVFDTTESKTKALSDLNGKHLKKRYITIQEANAIGSNNNTNNSNNIQPRPQPENCRTIFVKNLPYQNITENDILSIFQSCGKIVDGGVRLARNSQTNHLKGFGYVEFKNPEGAFAAVQRAVKGDGICVGGRICYVDYDESNGGMKGSFRTADGKLWKKQHGAGGGSGRYGRGGRGGRSGGRYNSNNRFQRY